MDNNRPINTPSSCDSSNENSRVVKQKLPSINMATQAKLAQKLIDPKTATPKGGHSYGPYFLEYCLMAEYDLLHKQKSLTGVYVIPSALTPVLWHGVMFIRQGLYQGGIFRFQLFIPDTYPDADCPSLVFDPPIFHPIIDPTTGQLDVKRAFPKWKRHLHHVWQVLVYAKRCFYKIDTTNPLNDEASKLYESDLEFYKYKVSESNKKSHDKLYDPPKSEDPHLFRFEMWDEFKYKDAYKLMFNTQERPHTSRPIHQGLSWMSPDKLAPFQTTKPNTYPRTVMRTTSEQQTTPERLTNFDKQPIIPEVQAMSSELQATPPEFPAMPPEFQAAHPKLQATPELSLI